MYKKVQNQQKLTVPTTNYIELHGFFLKSKWKEPMEF